MLIVGLGGLGAAAATALARTGVHTLGLVDPDVVDPSNLHRQLLYSDADVGRAKVTVAAERLRALAPAVAIHSWVTRLDASAHDVVRAFDAVVDGTDSVASKFDVNDVAVACGVPLVHAGVLGLRAQIMTVLAGESACYRCVFEEAPPPGETPSCEDAGVLGPVATFAGAVQAIEAIRVLSGLRPALADALLTLDVASGHVRTVPLARRPRCATCGGVAESLAAGRRAAS